ncbi:MAG TPA: hypothetical protein VLI67_11170 [Vicinamibacteria bacterium]|nr:hypothetical protein [Vicinamibacteria bacterium]
MRFPADPTSTLPAGAKWPRRALAVLWVLALAAMASSVTSSWEGLMARLSGPPAPASPAAPAAAGASTRTPGERAIAEARRLGEGGDLEGALAALDSVLPQDPAYPFARHLREQAAEALRSGGRWR